MIVVRKRSTKIDMHDPNDVDEVVELLRSENADLKRRVLNLEQLVANSSREFNKVRTISEELHLSEQRFRSLVEGVTDYAIFMLDPIGQIVSWNSGAQRIKGYSADEIIGKHFSCFYRPDEIAAGKPQAELEIAETVGRYEEEGLRVRKGGEIFWALVVITPLWDASGSLCGFAKVTRDISDRKRAEEKTRIMVELALNAMILVDVRGTLVQVNPKTEQLFGYTQIELLGQSVDLLVPDKVRAEHPAHRAAFFANPSVRTMGAGRDLYGRRKDGTLFPVEIGLNPVQSGGEQLVLGSIIDITERKRIEEKARLHLAELAHAGRLSTVGEMFSGFAHEINQPLAAAANYSRAGVRYARSDPNFSREQLIDWMEKAAAQSERASQIVKRLGTFTKKDRSIRTRLEFASLIEDVIALTSVMTSSWSSHGGTNVRLSMPDSPIEIFADKVQIEQVLVNLIRNAVEAMEVIPEEQRRLTIETTIVENFLNVAINDNGQGISAEDLPKLFNPFFTTKDEGMGLGLSISRSIIEEHGGQMTVKSDPESGTTFSFSVPLLKEETTE